MLLDDLIDRAKNHAGEMGVIFLKLADYMKMYSIYCSNTEVCLQGMYKDKVANCVLYFDF